MANITGTSAADRITGTAESDSLIGLGGADTLYGSAGNDWLDGGDGNDYLSGDLGDDTLIGGAGDDYLDGGTDTGGNLLQGGDGNDTLSGGYGSNDTLQGGAGDDRLYDMSGFNILDGGAGNDRIEGIGALLGGAGNDRIEGTGALIGGAGNDQLISSAWSADRLTGGPNTDVFSLNDNVWGGDTYVDTITDFTPGVGGDVIDLTQLLTHLASTSSSYDGGNPFGSSGFVRLVQSGADTLLQTDVDGSAGSATPRTIAILAGVQASTLVSDNFSLRDSLDDSSLPGVTRTGSESSETLSGTDGTDTLIGLGGQDNLYGGLGSDLLNGGTGNDYLNGGVGNDLLLGSDGNDYLSDYSGNNTLQGEAGDDQLSASAGTNILDGGVGNDRIEGTGSLIGGAGNDQLVSRARSADRLEGGAGNDTFSLDGDPGADGAYVDTIADFTPGAGGDVIDLNQLLTNLGSTSSSGPAYDGGNPFGGGGFVRLVQSGADTLLQTDADGGAGSAAPRTIAILAGIQISTLTNGNFNPQFNPDGSPLSGITRSGGESSENLTGTFGDDTLIGLGGQDNLNAGFGHDLLDGGAGNDNLHGDFGSDTLIGGPGNDYLHGDYGNDLLQGGDGNDYLSDFSGTNTLQGGSGDDQLFSSVGANILDGGAGNDRLEGTGSLVGGAGSDQLISSARSADRLEGGTGNDIFSLDGNPGPDGTYVDTIADFTPGAGGDVIDLIRLLTNLASSTSAGPVYDGGNPFGSGGFVRLVQSGADTLLQTDVDGSTGSATPRTVAILSGIQASTLVSGNFNPLFPPDGSPLPGTAQTGSEGHDILTGTFGNDTLIGNDGPDNINGNFGHDLINGGSGDDYLHGDFGSDTIIGDSGNDNLNGGYGNDLLQGGIGDDILSDYSGNNTLQGGDGDDTLYGNSYTGAGNDLLQGGAGNDRLYDRFGANSLDGGDGNDLIEGSGSLIGGTGNDRLTSSPNAACWLKGDTGSDTFVINSWVSSAGVYGTYIDTIADFTPGAGGDVLDVTRLLPGIAGYTTDSDPFGITSCLRLAQSGADTLLQIDPDGPSGSAPFRTQAILVGVTATQLTAENLVPAAIPVLDPNTPPELVTPLADAAAQEDQPFRLTLPAGVFTDSDAGDVLTLSATLANDAPLPAWLAFDPATRSFAGTPLNADVGRIEVKVIARDHAGATASDVFALSVRNVNDAPVAGAPQIAPTAPEDSLFTWTVPADAITDADTIHGDTLTWIATRSNGGALPRWLRFDSATRTFSGTPDNSDVGTVSLRLTATDSSGASARTTVTLNVGNTNDAPTVTAVVVPDRTLREDQPHTFTIPAALFTDADTVHGDRLTWFATKADGSALPDWLRFEPATRRFTATPGNSDVGSLAVRVGVRDQAEATASDSFNLTVTNVNDAPVAGAPLPGQAATEDSPFAWTVPADAFSDVDSIHGDTLRWAASRANGGALPGWLRFDPATRSFSGTPGDADAGTLALRVTVTDSSRATARSEFALAVTNTNDTPVAGSALPARNAREDSPFTYTVPANAFRDADTPYGDTLVLSATRADGSALPDWLRFDTPTRTFLGLPGNADVGRVALRVTATDRAGATANSELAVTVSNANDAPVVGTTLSSQSAPEGHLFNFTVPANAFADVDSIHGDTLILSATQANGTRLPSWLTFNASTATFSGTPPRATADLTLRVVATDTGRQSAMQTFAVTTPTQPAAAMRAAGKMAGLVAALDRQASHPLVDITTPSLTGPLPGGSATNGLLAMTDVG